MSRYIYITDDCLMDIAYKHMDDNALIGLQNALEEIDTTDVVEVVHGEMNDLISRQVAIDLVEKLEIQRLKGQIELLYAPTIKGLMALPSAQPTVDVVEVVHGKWVPTRKDSDISFCSNCESYWIIRDDAYDYLYCPKCGAKMEVHDAE